MKQPFICLSDREARDKPTLLIRPIEPQPRKGEAESIFHPGQIVKCKEQWTNNYGNIFIRATWSSPNSVRWCSAKSMPLKYSRLSFEVKSVKRERYDDLSALQVLKLYPDNKNLFSPSELFIYENPRRPGASNPWVELIEVRWL